MIRHVKGIPFANGSYSEEIFCLKGKGVEEDGLEKACVAGVEKLFCYRKDIWYKFFIRYIKLSTAAVHHLHE